MKLFSAALAATALLGFASVASADTISLWTLNNVTFQGGEVAKGSFTFDQTTDKVLSWDIAVTLGNSFFDYEYSNTTVPAGVDILYPPSPAMPDTVEFAGEPGFNPTLTLSIKPSNFFTLGSHTVTDAAMGGVEDGSTLTCNGGPCALLSTSDATLTGTAVPEPMSLALLATGLVGLGLGFRKRL